MIFIPGAVKGQEKQKREAEAIDFLQSSGALPPKRSCESCQSPMKLYANESRWRCKCGHNESVRTGTWFSGIGFPLYLALTLIRLWSAHITVSESERLVGGIVTRNTIGDFYSRIRRLCCLSNLRNRAILGRISGPDTIVEIDETMIMKVGRKFGGNRKQLWIFGGTVRGNSRRCFMSVVPDRTANTLFQIIWENIEPGVTIMSDGWSSYRRLTNLGYKHQVILHDREFTRKFGDPPPPPRKQKNESVQKPSSSTTTTTATMLHPMMCADGSVPVLVLGMTKTLALSDDTAAMTSTTTSTASIGRMHRESAEKEKCEKGDENDDNDESDDDRDDGDDRKDDVDVDDDDESEEDGPMIHTQRIESLWRVFKLRNKVRNGVQHENIPQYIEEFVWRRHHDDHFSEIMKEIGSYDPEANEENYKQHINFLFLLSLLISLVTLLLKNTVKTEKEFFHFI